MKVVYKKRFLKELAQIPARDRRPIERFVFEELPLADAIERTKRFERLKGHPGFYRARFGSYRLGARVEKDKVFLERALHRKDMYRKFP